MITTLRNGLIYDGSGNEPRRGDMLIHDSEIVKIAPARSLKRGKVLELNGLEVWPGFIDPSGSLDRIMNSAEAIRQASRNFYIKQGITSVIIGNRIAGRAPVTEKAIHAGLFKEVNPEHNIWDSVSSMFQAINKHPYPINIGTYCNYETVRLGIINNKHRSPTIKELERIRQVIRKTAEEGARGVSLEVGSKTNLAIDQKEISLLINHCKTVNHPLVLSLESGQLSELQLLIDLIRIKHSENISIILTDTPHNISGADYAINAATKNPISFKIKPLRKLLTSEYQEYNHNSLIHLLRSKNQSSNIFIEEESVANLIIAGLPLKYKQLLGKTIGLISDERNESPIDTLRHLARISETHLLLLEKNTTNEEHDNQITSLNTLLTTGRLFEAERVKELENSTPFLDYVTSSAENNHKERSLRIHNLCAKPAALLKIQKRGTLTEGYFADCLIVEKTHLEKAFVNGTESYNKHKPLLNNSGTAI